MQTYGWGAKDVGYSTKQMFVVQYDFRRILSVIDKFARCARLLALVDDDLAYLEGKRRDVFRTVRFIKRDWSALGRARSWIQQGQNQCGEAKY